MGRADDPITVFQAISLAIKDTLPAAAAATIRAAIPSIELPMPQGGHVTFRSIKTICIIAAASARRHLLDSDVVSSLESEA